MTTPLSAIGATADYTTPANPKITIEFNSVKAAINWDTAPTAGTENLEPWITAILKMLANFDSTATNVAHMVTASQPFEGAQQRNALSKATYTFTFVAYQVNNNPPSPDGDNF